MAKNNFSREWGIKTMTLWYKSIMYKTINRVFLQHINIDIYYSIYWDTNVCSATMEIYLVGKKSCDVQYDTFYIIFFGYILYI